MYVLTIIQTPYCSTKHICHTRLYVDLKSAMRYACNTKDDMKLWSKCSWTSTACWYFQKKYIDADNDTWSYAIEELSDEDLKPCDALKQMKMDI